jgi:hypothetical protein
MAVGHEHEGIAATGDEDRADVVAERIEAILGAAERAAAAIRDEAEGLLSARRAEAEREAARIVAEARERADELVAKEVSEARELARTLVGRATELLRRLEDADSVRRQVEGLLGDLDDVTSRMDELSQQEVEAEAEAETSPNGNGSSAGPSTGKLDAIEEARLMALQMAMAGRTRAEVETDLRHGLHVDDPEAVLDDVFGKGTPGSQRIPWSGVAEGGAS